MKNNVYLCKLKCAGPSARDYSGRYKESEKDNAVAKDIKEELFI